MPGDFVNSHRFNLAFLFFCMSVSPTFGGPLPCSASMFMVDAKEDAMANHLCAMATEIRGKLESCGLKQSRPLKIEMVAEIVHPLGKCMAYFDCEYDLVRVTDPSAWHLLLEEHQSYAKLPVEVTLRAVLTHEIAHALVIQTAGDRKVSMVDQEYIAAAMEIEFMDDVWRNLLLAATPMELPPKEGLIDIWIYGFAPRKFGVNAWQHFNLPENGCSLVQKIVEGDASFSKKVRPELR